MSLYRTCSVDTLNWNVAKLVPRSQSTSVNPSSAVEVSNTLQPRAKVPSWYRDLHHAVLLTDTDDSVDGSDVNNSVQQRTDSMDVEISFNLPRRHHRAVKPRSLQRAESSENLNKNSDYEYWNRSTHRYIEENNRAGDGLQQLRLQQQLTHLGHDIKSKPPATISRQKDPSELSCTGCQKQMTSPQRQAPHRDSIAEYPSSNESVPLMRSSKENSDDVYSLRRIPFCTTPILTGNLYTGSSNGDDREDMSCCMKWKDGSRNFYNYSGENGSRDWTGDLVPHTLGMDRDSTKCQTLRHEKVSDNRCHSTFNLGPTRQRTDTVDQPNKKQFKWKVAEIKSLNRPVSVDRRGTSNSSGLLSGKLRRASTQVAYTPPDGGVAVSRQPDDTWRGGRWAQRTSLDDVATSLADRDFYVGSENEPTKTEQRSTLTRFRSVETLYDGNRRPKTVTLDDRTRVSNGIVKQSQLRRLGEASGVTSIKSRSPDVGETVADRRSSDATNFGGWSGAIVGSSSTFQTRSELAATSRRSSTAQIWSPIIRLASSEWSPFSNLTSSGASGGRADNVPPCSVKTCSSSPSTTLTGASTSIPTWWGNFERNSAKAQRPETFGVGASRTGSRTETTSDARRLSSTVVVQIGGEVKATGNCTSKPTVNEIKFDKISTDEARGDEDRVLEKIAMTSASDIRSSAESDIRSSARNGDSIPYVDDRHSTCDRNAHQSARSRSVLNVSLSGSAFYDTPNNGCVPPAVAPSANGVRLSSSMFVTLRQTVEPDLSAVRSTETTPKIRVLTGNLKEYPR